MLGLFRALMPHEDRYFGLFDRHSEILVETAYALRDMLKGGERVPEHCARISDLEHQADDIAREVLLTVRRTFITPFDRSDIQGLAGSLDDAVDQMQQTAKTVALYELRSFDETMRRLGDLIVEAAETTGRAVPLLRAMGRNAGEINTLTLEVNRLEGRSDDLYDAGRKALFQSSRADPMAYIMGAEIYGHLEEVLDRLEDVADRIDSILVEHL